MKSNRTTLKPEPSETDGAAPRSGLKNIARCEASGPVEIGAVALKGRKILASSRTFSAGKTLITSRSFASGYVLKAAPRQGNLESRFN